MSDNDDDKTKPDMTRIEDLSEFLHPDDPEADAQLDLPSTPDEEEAETFETMSLDDLEDDESPPAFSNDDESEDEAAFQTDNDEDFSSSDDSFSNESTQPDIELSSALEDTEEETSFESDETDFTDSADQDFGESSFEESNDDESDSFSLEEVDSLDEEAKLQEEVDNEIQEALEEDLEEETDSFSMEEDNESFEMEEPTEEEDVAVFETEDESETANFEPIEDEEEIEDSFSPIEEPESEAPTVSVEKTMIEDSFSRSHQEETAAKPVERENFKDLNEFGNAISYGQVAAGGNPPFSIVLRKIKYLEDSERIIEILREHGLCDESNEADFQQGLNNGSMLISQLNEYSAIYLAHKFRRFDLEILVGLSDELHPSKNYDMDYRGLIRKENLTQNKQETFSLEEQVIQVEAILLATTPTLENYRIDRYLGLVSAHIMIEEEEFQRLQEIDLKNKNEQEVEIDPDALLKELESDREESNTASIEIGLEEIYQNLAESLKTKAFKLKGNAVVGINYQITPLINQKPTDQSPSVNYKISCTGNAVWVGGKEAPRSEA